MNFKEKATELLAALKKYQHILIFIKGSPDPDALAAAFTLKLLCASLGIKTIIDSPDPPSLPQNIRLVKDLHLPVRFKALGDIKKYDAYIIVDHQSVFVEGITGVIPCAVQLDHHEIVDEQIPVDCKILMTDIGSTSSILTLLLEEIEPGIARADWQRAATALYYGIQTDTDDFVAASPLDKKAQSLLAPWINKNVLYQLNHLPMPEEIMIYLNIALQHQVAYEGWLITGIGYIDWKHRDDIAIIGDFLLKREDVSSVVIFAIVEKNKGSSLKLDASIRTKKSEFNLNRFIKAISKEGGARRYKGAFQVNLDYFLDAPDKELLWQLVNDTTIEAVKKNIDASAMGGFRQVFDRLNKKVASWFR